MRQRYLMTGGAGFIGSRLAARLAGAGDVHVMDSLHPQVHGPGAAAPELGAGVELFHGDVRDPQALEDIMKRAQPTVIVHLAAETGTGQSFDEVARYCEVNVTGTARLIEAIRAHGPDVSRVVLASSRAVYGEGPQRFPDGSIRIAAPRSAERMACGDFEVRTSGSDAALVGVPANSSHGVAPVSVYGATKLMQEYLLLHSSIGAGWRPVILRLQNVYGPGQSLRNPYTGVLSIFCAQLLGGKGIDIYEDGKITRDFVYVDDVVEALLRAADPTMPAPSEPIDIGCGHPCTILQAAEELVRLLAGEESRITVSGKFRPGDIRFAAADITRARQVLHWNPRVTLEEGLQRLAEWSKASSAGPR